MGFFSLHETCGVCGGDTGFNKRKIANHEYLCSDCYNKLIAADKDVLFIYKSSQEIRDIIDFAEESKAKLFDFSPTQTLGLIEMNESNKKWVVNNKVFDYSDIIEFELLEDGESVTKGGLGRAVVGGVVFGGIGAVVGGVTGNKKNKPICNSLKIKITLSSKKNPIEYIEFLGRPISRTDSIFQQKYNLAQECLSALQIINSTNEATQNVTTSQQSTADEIMKFKQLYDAGAITREEYEAKKKQLLDI